MNIPPPDHSPRFESGEFPVLRDLLRGYFHQDWNDDYGSAHEAVEQFCRDAGKVSAAKLAAEWEQLNRISAGHLDTTVDLLGRLGGAWNPTSQDELKQISQTLAKYTGSVGRK
jgi:contact-dependent growth inhibition (CDI) system CdiI-like immunity protein